MINISALSTYLAAQGVKYIMPKKAGNLKETMKDLKREGQEARLVFSQIAKDFQVAYPNFTLERVSNWVNQAQIARPHFWVYLRQEEAVSDPMFAFRLYENATEFGISVEVSIIERKRDEESLAKQARILEVAPIMGTYYQYVENDASIKLPATEENRQLLKKRLENGDLRKVLIKTDIPLCEGLDTQELINQLHNGVDLLRPYYEATRIN